MMVERVSSITDNLSCEKATDSNGKGVLLLVRPGPVAVDCEAIEDNRSTLLTAEIAWGVSVHSTDRSR